MSVRSRSWRALGLAGLASLAAAVLTLPATAAPSPLQAPVALAAADLPPYVVVQGPELVRESWVLPVDSYRLTGRFAMTSSLWSTMHTGLDFAAPSGTPIHAVAAGVVTSVAYDGAYGRRTVVTLPDGTETWYCHQSTQAVWLGQVVAAGEELGTVGTTGNVTGPHLHLEVRPAGGEPVDPEAALLAHGVRP